MSCKPNQRKLCGRDDCKMCYDRSFASHPRSIHWNRELNDMDSNKVHLNSNKKFWFTCSKCGHNFEMRPNQIAQYNSWCTYCTNKLLCNNENCQICYEKSFETISESKYWSDENPLTPRQVFKNSGRKYKFKCPDCRHTFDKIISNITTQHQFCIYCSNGNTRLCKDESCRRCHERSFASHSKRAFWSKDNKLMPRQVPKNSNSKFYFDCDVCGHIFACSLLDINQGNSWCPYCAHKRLCDNENCQMCHENSFASNPKSQYWSDVNKLSPRQVFKNSHYKYYFNCPDCHHHFNIGLREINLQNQWCAICRHKTELKLFKHLTTEYDHVVRDFKPFWCKNKETNRHMPFDFFIEKYKTIIELDGEQHFIHKYLKWKTPEEIRKRDILKMNLANDHGYTIIRLLQKDVYHDKNSWAPKLRDNIIMHETSAIIYICSNNEYDVYKK